VGSLRARLVALPGWRPSAYRFNGRPIMLSRVICTGSAFGLAAAIAAASLMAQDKAKPADEGGEHFRAKQILGAKVMLEGNTSVGTIDDIVMDEQGNVDYLIVINSNNKLVTVPWDATKFNLEKRMAVVNIPQDQFLQVPTYTVQTYPDFSVPTYRPRIYRYYGLTPGQQRRAIRRGAVLVP
jgi:sporulation protein YlmC with PRC-barrel domain